MPQPEKEVVGNKFLSIFSVLQQSLPGIYNAEPTESPEAEPFHVHYNSFRTLMTANELAFYRILRSAIPEAYMICPKVRIADLLHYSGRSSRYGGLLRIANKHVDFAVVRESDATLVMAIELDSHHHQWKKKTIDRDRLVNEAFLTAGLPLARFDDKIEHSVSAVRAKLKDCYQPVAA